MKKLFAFVLVLLLFSAAIAEYDLSGMTDEELYELRAAINTELGERRAELLSIEEGITIAQIFPDPWLAKNIRDKLGKFSTNDVVTQAELDTITRLSISGNTTDHIQVISLEGIQYLRNLDSLEIRNQNSVTSIPDWVSSLTHLKTLEFSQCDIDYLPDFVCDLVSLKSLDMSRTNISALPEDIGNLVNLKSLNISYTNITSLPESIYNLNLDKFNRSGLDLD